MTVKKIFLVSVVAVMMSACAGAPKMDNSALEGCQRELAQAHSAVESLTSERDALLEQNRGLESLAQERQRIFEELRGKLQSLIDAGQVSITFRNGLMVLVMPNEVLFESGSAALKTGGKSTVTQVAKALKDVENRRFLVVGHTDNVGIKAAASKFQDNWELANQRSVSVVRLMVTEGVSAKALGTGGFSEFDPIASNDTDQGRAMNRRIEVIVLPNLGSVLEDAQAQNQQ